MNFEVDRCSGWAHIALCADLTWASEPPDAFILANQRLLAQQYRISQVFRTLSNNFGYSQYETTDNEGLRGKTVKDVIPESRLAQFYGNFVYDEARENCYTNDNHRSYVRNNVCGSESSDQTECWMLPEVEYWFRKLMDDSNDRNMNPRRRRQYKLAEDDLFLFFKVTINKHQSAASERWVQSGSTTDETLEERIRGVRALWHPQVTQQKLTRPPSPPATSRKIRARRRQPRRPFTPPPPYVLSNQLLCDPSNKFDVPRQPMKDIQKAMGRLSTNIQAVIRANSRTPYRGTQVSRYTPTCQRPRYDKKCIWLSRNVTKLEKINNQTNTNQQNKIEHKINFEVGTDDNKNVLQIEKKSEDLESKELETEEQPSTSASKTEIDRKKRLYSTVLSTNPPSPININASSVRTQKFTPGFIKLNPKVSARFPTASSEKFEELEKQALEQYKASDESIDTKFRELEQQAVEQYSTSNTSCSSDNSTKKSQETQTKKSHKEKRVDSVVIYSQNFPDLNGKRRISNLKNFHTPPRGEKKEQAHRSKNVRHKVSQRAASDTDYEALEVLSKGIHKSVRWTVHGMQPKKRHLSLSVSDLFSEDESSCGPIKGPNIKNFVGKTKMFTHGAGDLETSKKIS